LAPQAVRLMGVSKRFAGLEAIRPLDLEVERGAFLAILGPSGCGKTTLLRMIGGFVAPTGGRIEVAGQDVTRLPPERRPTNMVFQGYGLFPHMNVRQNIAYGLTLKRLPRAELDARVARVMALVRLGDLAERGVGALSGGQQQRVAVARALVMEPPVLLLDEPFAALDLKLRQSMQDELARIHREVGGTFMFVTHDQGEALALASRIAVMNEGRIEQIGTPEEVYLRPASRFVATFIGEANLLEAECRGGSVVARCGLRCASTLPEGAATIVVRQEAVRVLHEGETADQVLSGVVEDATFLGAHLRYTLRLPSGERLRALDELGRPRAAVGAELRAGWSRDAQRLIAEPAAISRDAPR
jgi:spermidine/putrescine transport system ATP-binding protein